MNLKQTSGLIVSLIAAVSLAACGGGGGGATATPSYTIGGTVSGLNGSVVLQNNSGDDLTVSASGSFTFASKVSNNSTYAATVLTQPTGQTCSVSTGSGTVSGSNVSNVAVTCSANAYTVGGTISGLTGTVVLQDNSGDDLSVSANGAFTFASPVAYGSPYSVTVLTQPSVSMSCSVANGTGTMAAANVSNVAITCATNTYTVGGTVSGLSGSVVLQDNGADNTTVSVNGSFNFPTAVAYGNPYLVSVLTQPAHQFCSLSSSAGTASGNVSNVGVSCLNQLGGSVQGAALNLVPTVSTIAGDILLPGGFADGTGTAARFQYPYGAATDGINLYVADEGNHTIRQIVIKTGVVTTLAGQAWVAGAADGAGTAATFNTPRGITTDGTNLYVADNLNNKIRKIVIATGVVSSLTGTAGTAMALGAADGAGSAATFARPNGITADGANLYVADQNNNTIRQIVIATGAVTTLAGQAGSFGSTDGAGAAALFKSPAGITTDGTNLYVTDLLNNKIRKIVIATGVVSSVTGGPNGPQSPNAADGPVSMAGFNLPIGITTDGSNLYVVDQSNNKIRKIELATGLVSSLTGSANLAMPWGATDGAGTAARFNYPAGITSDGSSLYVMDWGYHTIRKIQ